MSCEPANNRSGSHLLREISGIPPKYVDLLKKHWIETAEEVVALSGLPSGTSILKTLLEIDDANLSDFLSMLSGEVGEKAAQELRKARPGGPLGVILTEQQRERLGLE